MRDDDPFSLSRGGGLEDTSLVDKYRMTDEAYDNRKGTLRCDAGPFMLRSFTPQAPLFSLAVTRGSIGFVASLPSGSLKEYVEQRWNETDRFRCERERYGNG